MTFNSTLSLLMLAATPFTAHAQDRFDLKVRDYFFAGFRGDKEALNTGIKKCEDELAAHPKNAEALVWHGSGIYYLAGQAFQAGDQQKGGELFERGMKEMDDAVALAPDNVGVRIPRGAVLITSTHYMPEDVAKPLLEKAVQDYQHVYELQSPALDTLGAHPKGELLLGLADGYSRLGNQQEAEKLFSLIRSSMKGTAYARSADVWFEIKKLAPAQAGCLGCHTSK
jgi:tetratricopeptide (TPR) repeat protein